MTQADRVLSTPPINTPVNPSRRGFLAQAAVAAAGGATLGLALPLPGSAGAAQRVLDPIHAAIQLHRAACIVWNAAVDVRADYPEDPKPLTNREWEQREILDKRLDTARDALNKAGVDLISTVPTTFGGMASAIAYMQRQMRDDGTHMPFDVEFQYDDGFDGDSAVVLGWIDAFLNTIAVAVSVLDHAGEVVAL